MGWGEGYNVKLQNLLPSLALYIYICVCVFVCVCARARARMCMNMIFICTAQYTAKGVSFVWSLFSS